MAAGRFGSSLGGSAGRALESGRSRGPGGRASVGRSNVQCMPDKAADVLAIIRRVQAGAAAH